MVEIDALRRPQVGVCAVGLEVPAGEGGDGLWDGFSASDDAEIETAEMLVRGISGGRWHALLIVAKGRAGGPLRVQLRAENRSADGPGRLFPTGPAMARATAPAAELVRAFQGAGFETEASSEGPCDTAGALLFRTLLALADCSDAPPVGLVRVPADASGEAVDRMIGIGAPVMARRLAPLRQVVVG
ncbi:hypothetical protein [Brevundimonas balnearis]|uniref:Uncharacterized protein n=1 Tax=Brevundimonas balnearis TaxID=1572858 RepID=A0ABV6R0U8_9CAUL